MLLNTIRLVVCSLVVADAFVSLQSAHSTARSVKKGRSPLSSTQNIHVTERRTYTNIARRAFIPDPSDMHTLLADSTSLTSNDDHTTDIAVFIAGLIPFGWATIEFWRRIAVGASFGTGADSVVIDPNLEVVTIGEDGAPMSSRGRQVLGKGALAVAYLLFGIAIAVLGLTAVSVLSVPLDATEAVANSASN